jgi:hypothetical protein
MLKNSNYKKMETSKSKSKTRKKSMNKDLPQDKENQNGPPINLVNENNNEQIVKEALKSIT